MTTKRGFRPFGPARLRCPARRSSGLGHPHKRFHSVCIAVVAVTSGKTGSPRQDLSGHPRISGILEQKRLDLPALGWEQTAVRHLGILWRRSPPPFPVGLSKQNFWGMLSKLSDTSWNGIIYPPMEATSFAFLASVTLRRGLCPETRPTAAAVILARPSSPEGEEPRRVCVCGGEDGCGNLPGQMGTVGPQMNLLALGPCSLFSDLAPGIWKVRCGTGLGASRQNEAGARKEVRASETYGILR